MLSRRCWGSGKRWGGALRGGEKQRRWRKFKEKPMGRSTSNRKTTRERGVHSGTVLLEVLLLHGSSAVGWSMGIERGVYQTDDSPGKCTDGRRGSTKRKNRSDSSALCIERRGEKIKRSRSGAKFSGFKLGESCEDWILVKRECRKSAQWLGGTRNQMVGKSAGDFWAVRGPR